MQYDDLIGVKFVGNGRDEAGLDCLGLILLVLKRNGIEIPEPVDKLSEGVKPDIFQSIYEHYYIFWRELVKGERLKPLDVVMLRTTADYPCHLGILIKADEVLHCLEHNGVIKSRLSRLKRMITGYYRVKND